MSQVKTHARLCLVSYSLSLLPQSMFGKESSFLSHVLSCKEHMYLRHISHCRQKWGRQCRARQQKMLFCRVCPDCRVSHLRTRTRRVYSRQRSPRRIQWRRIYWCGLKLLERNQRSATSFFSTSDIDRLMESSKMSAFFDKADHAELKVGDLKRELDVFSSTLSRK